MRTCHPRCPTPHRRTWSVTSRANSTPLTARPNLPRQPWPHSTTNSPLTTKLLMLLLWTECEVVANLCWLCVGSWRSGPWFNIKISSYQYRKSHYGDKTVVRSSYLHNGMCFTGKMTSSYWIRPQDSIRFWKCNLKSCYTDWYLTKSSAVDVYTISRWHDVKRGNSRAQGPLLLTWINFNSSMDK